LTVTEPDGHAQPPIESSTGTTRIALVQALLTVLGSRETTRNARSLLWPVATIVVVLTVVVGVVAVVAVVKLGANPAWATAGALGVAGGGLALGKQIRRSRPRATKR
jgi:hypothetical protein